MSSEGKAALVTGGGAGIGKACVLRFVKEGIRVVFGDMSAEDGEKTHAMAKDAGGDVLFCEGNVANESDCQAWAQAALDTWGYIDILVANAGARVSGSILDVTEDDWDTIINVNLKEVVYSCKAILPGMIKRKSGSIVIISSANASVGRGGMPLYDATKVGVSSLARSLAVAHGKEGIQVNAICPGATTTDYHERIDQKRGVSPEKLRESRQGYALLGQAGEPYQIAAAVNFLASDEASNITGQALMVDGGLSVTSGA
ncbi:short-chain dehydrogenase [Candidatus Poribacteria bacterium]|nr:short-chain dehydrogenase [Candidatus Poribacteria bacterium]